MDPPLRMDLNIYGQTKLQLILICPMRFQEKTRKSENMFTVTISGSISKVKQITYTPFVASTGCSSSTWKHNSMVSISTPQKGHGIVSNLNSSCSKSASSYPKYISTNRKDQRKGFTYYSFTIKELNFDLIPSTISIFILSMPQPCYYLCFNSIDYFNFHT